MTFKFPECSPFSPQDLTTNGRTHRPPDLPRRLPGSSRPTRGVTHRPGRGVRDARRFPFPKPLPTGRNVSQRKESLRASVRGTLKKNSSTINGSVRQGPWLQQKGGTSLSHVLTGSVHGPQRPSETWTRGWVGYSFFYQIGVSKPVVSSTDHR